MIISKPKGGGPASPIEPAHYCPAAPEENATIGKQNKKLFSAAGKEFTYTINAKPVDTGAANSFPVARGSNRNADQAGLLAPAFLSPAPSHARAQWHLPDRWLLQWRDRAGLQPASLLSHITPDPNDMNFLTINSFMLVL